MMWYTQATHVLFLKHDAYSVETVEWHILSDLLLSLSQPLDMFLDHLLVLEATDNN